MSYLDRIQACNTHDLGNFVPFEVAGTRVGWVKRGFDARLADFPDAFAVTGGAVISSWRLG